MNTFNLTLDLDKRGGVAQWVTMRQGDHNGTELRATIYDHGTQAGGGYTCRVSIRLPGEGNEYYRETATYTNGVAVVTVDEEYAAAIVGVTEGYFELLQGDAVIASTESFGVRILRSAQDGAVPGDKYDSAIEDALAELDEATGRISQMVVDATEEYLEAHPELTTTVEDNSLTDAKLIQHGGILDRVARLWHRLDNLLTATPAESDGISVSDAAKTPLAGLSVYGRSTQDGTPTPSAPVAIQSVTPNLYGFTDAPARTSNGVTWTPQADGSIKAEGTATDTSYALGSPTTADFGKSYFVHLKKGGTYTATSFGRLQFNVFVMKPDGTTSTVAGYSIDNKTFTVADECYVQLGPRVSSGTVTNTTYHIVLVEGSTASGVPVPYQSVGLWARGRNLIQLPYDTASKTSAGITWTVNADGTITASGTATGNSSFVLHNHDTFGSFPAGTYTLSGSPNVSGVFIRMQYSVNGGTAQTVSSTAGTPVTFTANGQVEVAEGNYNLFCYVPSGTTINATFKPMFEIGSTAHAYQPYAESIVPIDLQGHELRSLPDGTRDEVTVDQYGHATLTVRCGEFTVTDDVTGVASFGVNANGTGWYYNHSSNGIVAGVSSTGTDNSGLCDLGAYYAGGTDGVDHFYVYGTRIYCRIAEQLADSTAAVAWYNAHKPTLVYKLAEPQTIDLGTIDPVALQGPDMTAQAVPTAPFALTYERDLNVTLARLEAAIADAATS